MCSHQIVVMLSLSKHDSASPSTIVALRATGGDPHEDRLCAALPVVEERFRPPWRADPRVRLFVLRPTTLPANRKEPPP